MRFIKINIVGLIIIIMSCTSDNYLIFVEFDNVYGLEEKSPVRYEGLEVGIVKDMMVSSDGKIISMIQFENGINIPIDSKFYLSSTGLIGVRCIDISRGISKKYILSSDTVVGFPDLEHPLDTIINKAIETLETFQEIADSIGTLE